MIVSRLVNYTKSIIEKNRSNQEFIFKKKPNKLKSLLMFCLWINRKMIKFLLAHLITISDISSIFQQVLC